MSPTTTKPDSKVHPLIAKHVEHVAGYFSTTGARRAQHSRAINELETRLWCDGIKGGTREQVDAGERDYVQFAKPAPAMQRSWDKSPDEVIAAIVRLREVRSDDEAPENVRATADRMLTQELRNAEIRQINVPAE